MRRPPDIDALLGRDEFRESTLARFKGACCACRSAPATEAHHIFDRKLFPDGGYRGRNGAPVCNPCHWKAETCAIKVPEMCRMAGVWPPLLPPHAAALGVASAEDAGRLDKWGNLLLGDGSIQGGPLASDDGCRKALAAGGLLWRVHG